MPSFRIRAFNVVLGIPRRVAALLTTPFASRSTRSIAAPRSDLLERIAAGGFQCIGPYFLQRSTKIGGPGKG